jgi:hypothetical protein
MDAVNRARVAGALGVGFGFFVSGLFGALIAPHVLSGFKGQGMSVGYLLVGWLFLLVSALLLMVRSRRSTR